MIIQEAGGTIKAAEIAVRYAKEMGCAIKLLGVARNTESGVEAYVCPMLIPNDHPLATVNDSYNAVFVHGDAVEDAMLEIFLILCAIWKQAAAAVSDVPAINSFL